MSSDSPFFDRFGQNERSGMGAHSRRRLDVARPPVATTTVASADRVDVPPVVVGPAPTAAPSPPAAAAAMPVAFDPNMFGNNALPSVPSHMAPYAPHEEAEPPSDASRGGVGTAARGYATSLPPLEGPGRQRPVGRCNTTAITSSTGASNRKLPVAGAGARRLPPVRMSSNAGATRHGGAMQQGARSSGAPKPAHSTADTAPLHDLEYDGAHGSEDPWDVSDGAAQSGAGRLVARGFQRTQQLQLTAGDYDRLEALTATEDFMERFNARSAALRAAHAAGAAQPQPVLRRAGRGPTTVPLSTMQPKAPPAQPATRPRQQSIQHAGQWRRGPGGIAASALAASVLGEESVYAALAHPIGPINPRGVGEVLPMVRAESGSRRREQTNTIRQYSEAELDEFVPVCRSCAARLLSNSQ